MFREAARFPVRALTAGEKRRRAAFVAAIERRTGFPLTGAETARAVRLRAGEGYGAPWLAAAIRTTRAARRKL
jgi:hypothetical protein